MPKNLKSLINDILNEENKPNPETVGVKGGTAQDTLKPKSAASEPNENGAEYEVIDDDEVGDEEKIKAAEKMGKAPKRLADKSVSEEKDCEDDESDDESDDNEDDSEMDSDDDSSDDEGDDDSSDDEDDEGEKKEFNFDKKKKETNESKFNIKNYQFKLKEEFDELFESETDLSESTKKKTATLFEAAVNNAIKTRAKEVEKHLTEVYAQQMASELDLLEEQVTNQIDKYLNYAVDVWLEKNKLAVEKGIRTELAEAFINDLANLIEQHWIEVPEDKVDIFEELMEEVETLQERLNEKTEEVINLKTLMEEATTQAEIAETFNEMTEGLSDIAKDKIMSLSESMSFKTIDEYKEKLGIIVENYTRSKKSRVGSGLEKDAMLSEDSTDLQVTDPIVEKFAKYMDKNKGFNY